MKLLTEEFAGQNKIWTIIVGLVLVFMAGLFVGYYFGIKLSSKDELGDSSSQAQSAYIDKTDLQKNNHENPDDSEIEQEKVYVKSAFEKQVKNEKLDGSEIISRGLDLKLGEKKNK